ncbi:redoxin domain-containing protein [uncultured Shewanella sp.]|uniref:TlpA family protein disulfide reductase n=1 Tax=uncultured Shewanella sp. TaxID=173975 RepID=UPI002622CBEB|nr:redoxin domain-containing protein [uncultured Shewanella sp.]
MNLVIKLVSPIFIRTYLLSALLSINTALASPNAPSIPSSQQTQQVKSQWLNYQHVNLVTHEKQILQGFMGKPSLLMFFEPECPWCAKQGKVFNQLLSQCPNNINIIALASHGNKTVLRKAAWKMRLHFPAYLADSAMTESLGPLPATPITLILDKQGQLHSLLRGYVKLEQLLPQLKQEFGLKCRR